MTRRPTGGIRSVGPPRIVGHKEGSNGRVIPLDRNMRLKPRGPAEAHPGAAVRLHARIPSRARSCLLCGVRDADLNGHLRREHEITWAEYEELYGPAV